MSDAGRPNWPYYCEENIWHLSGELGTSAASARVLVISNPGGRVAVWQQMEAPAANTPILWDYHVILLVASDRQWRIHDPASSLGCPVSATTYLDASFPESDTLGHNHPPYFRSLDALTYRRELRSDRRHMRDEKGGWLEPPPPWEPIGEGSNLMAFVDMENPFLGEVIDLNALKQSLREVPTR